LESGSNSKSPARSVVGWKTAGIPTGIAPDIHRQVELRKAGRATAPDNPATTAPANSMRIGHAPPPFVKCQELTPATPATRELPAPYTPTFMG